MFKLVSLATLALSAASAVHGVAIPRATAPSTYNTDILESYSDYNNRYMALDCKDQHNTQFFDDCCHPLLLTQKLSDRPAYCTPASSTTNDASASATPTPTPVANAAAAPPKASPSAAATTVSTDSASDGETFSGHATWFYQHSTAGACGKVHAETDKIVALDSQLYGNTGETSQYCGKSLTIKNKSNGKTTVATVADACPTCDSYGSIDLSQGAFLAIADSLDIGEFDVEWYWS